MKDTIFLILCETIIKTWYIWVSIIVISLLRLFAPFIKGVVGEQAVRTRLLSLNQKKYSVVHDVIIADKDQLTQIDHIVVGRSGVYVIETKNYKGMITGSETAANWTQHLGKKRVSFYNPIKQNYGHIMALSSALCLPISIFTSLIAFSPEAKVKVEAKTPVLYYSVLADAIQRAQIEVFTTDEMDRITKEIVEIKKKNKKLRNAHIKQVKKQKI